MHHRQASFGWLMFQNFPFAVWRAKDRPNKPRSLTFAVKILYTAIYSIRREARERMGKSFVEAPLEILYWTDDLSELATTPREKWHWHVQITLPLWADAKRLERSVTEMRNKLDGAPAPYWQIIAEGKCAQFLHVGETDVLPEVLQRFYAEYLAAEELEPAGPYHEIYLDDWSRVASGKRKILLRQPVR